MSPIYAVATVVDPVSESKRAVWCLWPSLSETWYMVHVRGHGTWRPWMATLNIFVYPYWAPCRSVQTFGKTGPKKFWGH